MFCGSMTLPRGRDGEFGSSNSRPVKSGDSAPEVNGPTRKPGHERMDKYPRHTAETQRDEPSSATYPDFSLGGGTSSNHTTNLLKATFQNSSVLDKSNEDVSFQNPMAALTDASASLLLAMSVGDEDEMRRLRPTVVHWQHALRAQASAPRSISDTQPNQPSRLNARPGVEPKLTSNSSSKKRFKTHQKDDYDDENDDDEKNENDGTKKNGNKKDGRKTNRISAHTQAEFDSEAHNDFERPPDQVWTEWSSQRQAGFVLFRSYYGRKLTVADTKLFASAPSVAAQVTNPAPIATKRQWIQETVMRTQGLPEEYPTFITLPNYVAWFEWNALPESTRGPFFGPQLSALHPKVTSDLEELKRRTEIAIEVRNLYFPM
jgi:hypothetical protein